MMDMPEPDIEITPEMIEAGVKAYYQWDDPVFHEPESIVSAIYRAMVRERRS